eukprot:g10954.t1
MASQYDANEWDRLIDEETQKAYWYNNYTKHKYKRKMHRVEYGRKKGYKGYKSLPSLSLYQNYKKIWSQSLRPGNSNKHIRNKDRRRQRQHRKGKKRGKKAMMVHKKAWNTRTASNNTPQNNNDNVNSLLKDYQDAAIIANRKYELRNTPKGAKVKGDGFGTGEVWDHELQMYYRKRYD